MYPGKNNHSEENVTLLASAYFILFLTCCFQVMCDTESYHAYNSVSWGYNFATKHYNKSN